MFGQIDGPYGQTHCKYFGTFIQHGAGGADHRI